MRASGTTHQPSPSACGRVASADAERVRRRLREMDRRLSLLEGLRTGGRAPFLDDVSVQAQVEHPQLALQSAIDVALHLAADAPGRPVEGYVDAFAALGERGVLPDGLASSLRAAAGMRNVLVHGYVDVRPDLVWDGLDGLDDLRRFAEHVDHFLEQPST